MRKLRAVASGFIAFGLAGAAAAHAADPERGQLLYESRCAGCHSLDAHRAGPAHRGVVGRRVGTAPGYEYSAALTNSGLVWAPRNLDLWLADPEALVPGQKMGVRVDSAADRADLIAYLVTAAAEGAPR